MGNPLSLHTNDQIWNSINLLLFRMEIGLVFWKYNRNSEGFSLDRVSRGDWVSSGTSSLGDVVRTAKFFLQVTGYLRAQQFGNEDFMLSQNIKRYKSVILLVASGDEYQLLQWESELFPSYNRRPSGWVLWRSAEGRVYKEDPLRHERKIGLWKIRWPLHNSFFAILPALWSKK